METLRKIIASQLFASEGSRFAIVRNRDCFLLREDVQIALSCENIKVFSGGKLYLRVIKETILVDQPEFRIAFIVDDDYRIMDDILAIGEYIEFDTRRLFHKYDWNTIRGQSLYFFQWLINRKQIYTLNAQQTQALITEYQNTLEHKQETIKNVLYQWDKNIPNIDFNSPGKWMPFFSELALKALKIGKWSDLIDRVDSLNDSFQKHLLQYYDYIVGSICPTNSPKIVTQVLPFIAKQNADKIALVVVDGMNYWQGIMLAESIKTHLGAHCVYDSLYSWLPSETQFSRQAIFLGEEPHLDYIQSPQNEKPLWDTYWTSRQIPSYKYYYQAEGKIEIPSGVSLAAYVTTELDSKMHASVDYRYLYANTDIWVEETMVLENIKTLLDKGYKIYLTTDHGNIETIPYKVLRPQDKADSNWGSRYIILSDHSEGRYFEEAHAGHVMQIKPESKTYYPVGRELFSSSQRVTHGGTHWLEVLIPFITVTK